MNKLLIQVADGGEKFEIWKSESNNILEVWNEIDLDTRHEDGCHIYLIDADGKEIDNKIMNGGF